MNNKNKNIYKWLIIGLSVLLIVALVFVIVSCSKKKGEENKNGFDIKQEAGKMYDYKNETDEQGRLVKHTTISPKGDVVGYEEYSYDEEGRLVSTVKRDANGNFKTKEMIIYVDKDFGDNIERKKEVIFLDESNTKVENWTTEYNDLGKKTVDKHFVKGELKDYVEYEYNDEAQLIKESSFKGNGQLKNYVTYTYDADGNEKATKYDANGNKK